MSGPVVDLSDYATFIERKAHLRSRDGFTPRDLPPALFDFQVALVTFACGGARTAVFADCGLGKMLMQLAWAEQVVRHANQPVLILTPLAVGAQLEREAERFGIDAVRSRDGRFPRGTAGTAGARIVITNYERLHLFDPADFAGVACDESSILKNFDGARKSEITAFMRKVPYRSLWTATAAPNDYVELGTSSEALGELGFMDMLGRFFKNDQGTVDTRAQRLWRGQKGREVGGAAKGWRFKGHAETPFWRWVASWARAMRRPSDLGFDDARFTLPPLEEVEHVIEARRTRDGCLFDLPAVGLAEQREELARTTAERCEAVAGLTADTGEPALVWCHRNEEGARLAKLIPGAVEVSGKDADEAKEEKFLAFASGEARVLVTKPAIGAWGLNFQHCAHVTFFPSHSYEQYYQAVRRCWRFGQTRPVRVDLVTTPGLAGVKANLQRKSRQADAMFAALVAHMREAERVTAARARVTAPTIPGWLRAA